MNEIGICLSFLFDFVHVRAGEVGYSYGTILIELARLWYDV